MKTLEDKLRELSLDELNKITVQTITSLENIQGQVHPKNFWKGSWEGKRKCPHCDDSLECIPYKSHHGDKCLYKGIDMEQLKKDWIGDSLTIDEVSEKYGIKRNSLLYFLSQKGIDKGITYDLNRECPHCYTKCSVNKYNHYHGDKCKVKDKLKTIIHKYESGQSLSSLSREYKLSFVTIRGYIQNYLKNN